MATFEVITSPAIGGGSSGSYLVAEVTLTNSQILNLFTTPIEIVPAPGVGKIIHIISGNYIVNTVAGNYTPAGGPGSTDAPLYINTNYMASPSGQAGLDEAPNIYYMNLTINQIVSNIPASTFKNFPLVIKNAVGNYTGGNSANTLKVTVYYVIVDL